MRVLILVHTYFINNFIPLTTERCLSSPESETRNQVSTLRARALMLSLPRCQPCVSCLYCAAALLLGRRWLCPHRCSPVNPAGTWACDGACKASLKADKCIGSWRTLLGVGVKSFMHSSKQAGKVLRITLLDVGVPILCMSADDKVPFWICALLDLSPSWALPHLDNSATLTCSESEGIKSGYTLKDSFNGRNLSSDFLKGINFSYPLQTCHFKLMRCGPW